MSVQTLLETKGIPYRTTGNSVLVHCLSPEHEDRNPSMSINAHSGYFLCYSCGFKGNIFRHFNILTNRVSVKLQKLSDKLNNLRREDVSLDMPKGSTPYSRSFRGISTKTLKKFETFYTTLVKSLEDRICFPIYDISGKITAFQCRHIFSDQSPKYLVYPRNAKLGLYPAKLENNSSSIILVEGIFDMLNMYDKGIHNVVCTFGTQVLNEHNYEDKMLPFKIQGVTKVYILFDGDVAGQTAAAAISKLLATEYEVEILPTPTGKDPGEFTNEDIALIKTYLT